jgi:hypothetical protein
MKMEKKSAVSSGFSVVVVFDSVVVVLSFLVVLIEVVVVVVVESLLVSTVMRWVVYEVGDDFVEVAATVAWPTAAPQESAPFWHCPSLH